MFNFNLKLSLTWTILFNNIIIRKVFLLGLSIRSQSPNAIKINRIETVFRREAVKTSKVAIGEPPTYH